MDETIRSVLEAAVVNLLRPLARMLLRHGVPYQGFAELAKAAYVDAARRDFALPGRKVSHSRISVLTGLTRKEVKRLADGPGQSLSPLTTRNNRAAAVLTGWLRDTEFTDSEGNPLPLPPDGADSSFQTLVRRHGRDAPSRAVLDELIRVGAVDRTADGRITLLQRGYVPAEGVPEKLGILGTDVADLLNTIDHNLQPNEEARYLQRKVSYDNIPSEKIPALRKLSSEEGGQFLERLDNAFAACDRDVHPGEGGSDRNRVTVGVYYWQQEVSPESECPVAADDSPGRNASREAHDEDG